MKLRWIALAAAGVVAACGGDGDQAQTPVAPPAQAEEYSMAVRPHLGTVKAGASLVLQPLLDDGPPLRATIPATGDPVFKVPRDRCGPGLVALEGSAVTIYFDEGTGKWEVLRGGENVRGLVPDICGADATRPVPLSMLDEIGLHIGSERAGELEAKIRQAREARGGDPASVERARRAAIASTEELVDDFARMVGGLFGLPEGYRGVLPTPIDSVSTVIPPTDAGQIAATLQAIQQAAAAIREAAMDKQMALIEAQAALVAQQAERLRQQNAPQKKPTAVIDSVLGPGADFAMRFGHLANADTDNAAKTIGASAAMTAQDVASVIDRIIATMKDSPAAITSLEKARTQARAQAPVANADMTLALRTALAPSLLRVEPLARLAKAVAAGPGRFSCTVGTVTRGAVSVTFVDLDSSGGLSDGDRFDMVYDNCLVAEPVSGMMLAKSGTMNVRYDARDPGATPPDIAGHVVFAMRFHADGGAAATKPATLFHASGQWMDRAAFAAPGAVAPSISAGATPAVLLDDATLTIRHDSEVYTTQIDAARFDLAPGLEDAPQPGVGAAALHLEGTVGGLRYTTGSGMVFARKGDALTLSQGDFRYERETGGSGSGSIAAGDGGLFATRLTDGAGVTTQRSLPWTQIVAAYLAK